MFHRPMEHKLFYDASKTAVWLLIILLGFRTLVDGKFNFSVGIIKASDLCVAIAIFFGALCVSGNSRFIIPFLFVFTFFGISAYVSAPNWGNAGFWELLGVIGVFAVFLVASKINNNTNLNTLLKAFI